VSYHLCFSWWYGFAEIILGKRFVGRRLHPSFPEWDGKWPQNYFVQEYISQHGYAERVASQRMLWPIIFTGTDTLIDLPPYSGDSVYIISLISKDGMRSMRGMRLCIPLMLPRWRMKVMGWARLWSRCPRSHSEPWVILGFSYGLTFSRSFGDFCFFL
jgi:hypothetical protein